jgi:hypothetical protein
MVGFKVDPPAACDDGFVDYPHSVAEVIQMVQDAVADGTENLTKNLFAKANELGCPLSGTRQFLCHKSNPTRTTD